MGVSSKPRAIGGEVTINPYKEGLRIRWRRGEARPEIYVSPSVSHYRQVALRIKMQIEQDLITDSYDETLIRYKEMLRKTVLAELIQETQLAHATELRSINRIEPVHLDFIKEFKLFAAAQGQNPEKMTTYYYYCLQMMKRWGTITLENVVSKLNSEKCSNRTYNYRRTCLDSFFTWLRRKKKIVDNPFEEIKNKRKAKPREERDPFTDKEAMDILEALRFDLHRPKASQFSHSQYYPFVAFMLHVGTRNGEAIGLRVKNVNFETMEICIDSSLSRTREGSHVAARVLKETKNSNTRYIPMDKYLCDLLRPLCKGRKATEYVFVTQKGNPIDDRMFQRRVFKPLLKKLEIEMRDLYACRHTFATRAVQQGMKPHEVAYLMGDNVDTVLETYFHNNRKPTSLPSAVSHPITKKRTPVRKVA